MRKELQHALTQKSSMCQDQLQHALRQQVCQEEYADAGSNRETNQLRQSIAEQAEATQRFESHSQHFVSQQQEEYVHKHHAQFQQFDSALRDRDEVIQSLKQELANSKERYIQELDQALQDAERRAQQPSPVFAAASTHPYATPVEKKTRHAVVAVAQAAPVPAFRSPGLSLGALAGNLNIKSRNKGSSAMMVPVRRRLRTKTPPAAAQRFPSMGLARRRMRAKGPPPQATSVYQLASWLEDGMTKLVVADEASARVEPRRAMSILMYVGKPHQTSDNVFMTLVTRIAATSKSQIASDCNRNSKKSLRLRKHPLKPNLWTRFVWFLKCFRSATWVWNPPRIRCDYKSVILNRSDFFGPMRFL